MSRSLIAGVSILIAAALLTGCTQSKIDASANQVPDAAASATPLTTEAFANNYVTVQGASFQIAGQPFRFVGANIYDAAASTHYSCRASSEMTDAQLLSTMRYLHDTAGATVLRFWAYQTYTQGATYWGGVDRVLADARAVGMKVIPVLEDGPGDCTNTPTPIPKAMYQGDTWYSAGYKVPYGNATMSYRDYVRTIVAHYADDPTILGWSMMNEADTSARTAQGVPVLVGFASDVASVIRSVDKNHLITVGTQGNGAPGASGPDFTAVYQLPVISFAEVHDWGYWGSDTEAMPGGDGATPPAANSEGCALLTAPIGCSFARAKLLDKPLVVGEAGIKGVTPAQRAVRATELRAKMNAAFAAGASGYLIWSVTTTTTDGYDLLTTTNDPLIAQLKQVSLQIK